jgi:RNA polymerase sigma factor (sigma-70 family)
VPPDDPTAPDSAPARRPAARPPFEHLVERHGPALLRFCAARLGPDRGEEAFQESLIAALRHYDDLRDPGAAAGWLFAIAQRKIVDAARSRARQPVPSEALEDHAAVWHDPEPGDDGIWSRVARLPPKQREAVGLRYLADLSHEDVARVAGTSVEAARRNVFEGLRRLRRELDEDRRDT